MTVPSTYRVDCDRIVVALNSNEVEKQLQCTEAEIDKGVIYLGGAKWKIKAKNLKKVIIETDEIIIKDDKVTAKLTRLLVPNAQQRAAWDIFQEKVQRLAGKSSECLSTSKRTNRSKSGVFSSSSSKSFRKRAPASLPRKSSWDDFPEKAKSKKDDLEFSNDEAISSSQLQRVEKRLRKLPAKGNNDNDTDHEDFLDYRTELTTPAAQRIVSPNSRTTKVQERASIDDEDTKQPRIDSLFSSAGPALSTTPKTPPPKSARSWKDQLAVTPPQSKRSKYWQSTSDRPNFRQKSEGQFGNGIESSSFLSRSPTRPSILQKRGGELFGSSAKRLRTTPTNEHLTVSSYRKPLRRQLISYKKNSSFTLPPADKEVDSKSCPYRGLQNLGNSCYMNASLQMLYSCTNLMESLQTTPNQPALTSAVCGTYNELKMVDPEVKTVVNPSVIKAAIDAKTDKFRGYLQRDAHEFLSDLIDHVHEELNPTPENGTVKDGDAIPSEKRDSLMDDFCLKVKSGLKCNHCGYDR